MAGGLDHPHHEVAHHDGVALDDGFVDEGNSLRFGAWPDHPAAMMFLQRWNALGMVGMIVRDQDVGETPPFLLQRRLDRGRVRSINGGGVTGLGVVQQRREEP